MAESVDGVPVRHETHEIIEPVPAAAEAAIAGSASGAEQLAGDVAVSATETVHELQHDVAELRQQEEAERWERLSNQVTVQTAQQAEMLEHLRALRFSSSSPNPPPRDPDAHEAVNPSPREEPALEIAVQEAPPAEETPASKKRDKRRRMFGRR